MIKAKMKNLALIALALVMAVSLGFGFASFSEKTADASTTYSQKVVAESNTTWSFTSNTSTIKLGTYLSATNDDNGLIFSGSDESTVQFKSGYLSCKAGGRIYFPVAANNNGSISMVASSSSDNRYFVPVVNGVNDTTRHIYSKPYATEQAGVKGPQTFDFTASDLALVGTNYYLILEAVGGEMKSASFTLIATPAVYTLSYDANGGSGAPADVENIDPTTSASQTVGAAPTVAPVGKSFAGWSDGTTIYQPSETIILSKSIALTAVWNNIITSIKAPVGVMKVYSSTLNVATLGLPETVVGVYEGGEVELDVVWDTDSVVLAADYSGVINGTASLPTAGFVFASGIGSTSVSVSTPATAPTITSVEAFEDVRVLKGSASVELPSDIDVFVGVNKFNLDITWDSTDYNLDAVATYPVSGDIALGGNFVLDTGVAATINVEVYAANVVSVAPEAITVAVDSVPTLPETVSVTFDDESIEDIEVVWGAVDTTAVGTSVVDGTLTLSSSQTNTSSVVAKLTVNVVNATTVAFNAFSDETLGTNYGVDWTTTYADKVLGSENGIVISATNGVLDSHDQTRPMVKLNKDVAQGISIVIPEKATSVSITLKAVTYAGAFDSTGNLDDSKVSSALIINPNGTTLQTLSIDASSNAAAADSNGAYQAFTANSITATDVIGGTYYISTTGASNNIYITNIVVVAVVPEMVSLSYNANGGVSVPNEVEVEKNLTATVGANAVAQEGYEFVSWNTQADGLGTTYTEGDEIVMTADLELFAIYNEQIVSVGETDFSTQLKLKSTADALAVEVGATVYSVFEIPQTISATLADNTPVTLDINWTIPVELSSYTIGSYTISGVIANDGTHNFASSVSTAVSMKIVVLETKLTIDSIEAPTAIEVELGETEIFPTAVSATLSDTTVVSLDVSWDTTEFDWNTVDSYSLAGTVEGFDTNAIELGVGVGVNLSVEVYNYTITDFATITGVNAFVGASNVDLPAKVVANYTNRASEPKTVELDVIWDKSAIVYTTATETPFVVSGSVAGTALYVVDPTMTASVNVNIVEYVSASTARSTNFIDQSTNQAGVFRGFTLTGTIANNDTNADYVGQKIKNGSLAFTLTASAKVTFGLFVPSSSTVTINGTTETIGTPGSFSIVTKDFVAGTYTLTISGSSSVAFRYIIIEDGGSEIFYAQSATATTAVLPSVPVKKTVDGIEYNFYGYTTKEATAMYAIGDTVAASEAGITYYAVYAKAELANGAAIKVVENVHQMKFTATLNALNAGVYMQNAITNSLFTFTTDVKTSEASVENAANVVAKADSIVAIELLDITDFEAEYTAYATVACGATELLNANVVRSAKQVATTALTTVDVADAVYKFETEDGKFSCFNTAERAIIASYIPEV